MKAIYVPVADIRVLDGRRKVDPGTVERIAESIAEQGIKTPVTIREDAAGFVLVVGAHRLAACRSLGMEQVPAFVMPDSATEIDARLWEISENLDRAELSALERSEHLDEWRRLTMQKVRQLDAPLGGSQPRDQGFRKTAEDRGVSESDVRRAARIASIPEPVKAGIIEAGLDNNQSAMLKIASAPEPAAKLAEIVEQRAAPKREPEPAAEPAVNAPADHPMFDAGDFAAVLQENADLRRVIESDDHNAELLKLIAELRKELEAVERQYHGAMADRNDLIRANKSLQRRLKDLSP